MRSERLALAVGLFIFLELDRNICSVLTCE